MNREEWNAIWSGKGHHDHREGHGHDGHADSHGHDHGDDAAHRHSHGHPDGLLVQEAANLKAGRALELGCGSGANAIWLAQQGWQVQAVDFSDAAIEQAQQTATKAGVAVDFVVSDLRDFEPNPQSYELVTFFYVHLPAPIRKAMLARAARAVAPGGRLLFVGHDRSDSDWFVQHVRSGHEHEGSDVATEERKLTEILATLTNPEEIATELPDLVIDRAEVVRHDPHCAGEDVGTTLVLAHRAG